MALSKKQLAVRKSTIPGSGKGLFTLQPVSKGDIIVEYKGRVSTWKQANHQNGNNGYIFYVNRNNVIDAEPYAKALGRYANDARGLQRVPGIRNNSEYITTKEGKVFIKALRNIEKGEEILVAYGKEYWDSIRHNKKLEEKERERKRKGNRKRKSV